MITFALTHEKCTTSFLHGNPFVFGSIVRIRSRLLAAGYAKAIPSVLAVLSPADNMNPAAIFISLRQAHATILCQFVRFLEMGNSNIDLMRHFT
jgi:hypothetical protein